MVLVWGCVRTLYRLLVAGRGRPRFVGHYRPLFRGHCGHPSADRRPILLRCGADSARDGETVDGVVPREARRFLSDPSRGEQCFEVASDRPLGEANASGKVFSPGYARVPSPLAYSARAYPTPIVVAGRRPSRKERRQSTTNGRAPPDGCCWDVRTASVFMKSSLINSLGAIILIIAMPHKGEQ